MAFNSQSQPIPDTTTGLPAGAYRIPLADTTSDAEQILAFLEQTKQLYIRSPQVREFSVGLLKGLENNDQVGQVNRIIDFVRSNLTYVRDPVDSEYVISPVQLLTQWQTNRFMAGDCDDHCLLLNTMLGTLGIDTKFVGVKFNNADIYNHVICGVNLRGQLYLVDPCSKFSNQPTYKDVLILP